MLRPPPAFAAAPTRARLGFPALMVGIIVLVAAAGVGGVLLVRHHAVAATDRPDTVISSAQQQPVVPPVVPSDDESSAVPPSSTGPDQPLDSASAKSALDGEVNQDRAAAEQLVGSWVPQLSSKRPGLVADGITYDYPQIWADFQRLRAQYPDALLLWSGDYVSFKLTDFYVTVVPQSFSDGESANQWCDDNGLAPAACYAKFLSHQGDSVGTSLLRN